MSEQERKEGGKFAAKGNAIREVRSIRLTDATWHSLGDKADEHDMSKADYLEALFSGEIEWEFDNVESDKLDLDFDVDEVVEKLKNALTLKGNVSRQLKAIIKEVLELMGEDLEEED